MIISPQTQVFAIQIKKNFLFSGIIIIEQSNEQAVTKDERMV